MTGKWATLRKHPKCNAAEPVNQSGPRFTELYRDYSDPETIHRKRRKLNWRPCGAPRVQDFGENVQTELKLKRKATREMYTMTSAKDATIIKLKEMKFLATSTAGLSDVDAIIINT
ncbi:hypothetical protein Tco_1077343 [Tanacetum coccineum]